MAYLTPYSMAGLFMAVFFGLYQPGYVQMRSKLKTVSLPTLLSQLQRIKVGELETSATKTRVVTRRTDEQKHRLALIGAPPIPSSLP